MSKTLSQLQQLDRQRKSKYTTVLARQQTEDASTRGRYLIVGFLLFVLCLTTFLSLNAFAQIKKEKSNTQKLTHIILSQDKKIQSLQDSLAKLNKNQDKQFNALEDIVKDIKRTMLRQGKDIAEFAIDNNILRLELNDMKEDSRKLLDQYIDLSEEMERMSSRVGELRVNKPGENVEEMLNVEQ